MDKNEKITENTNIVSEVENEGGGTAEPTTQPDTGAESKAADDAVVQAVADKRPESQDDDAGDDESEAKAADETKAADDAKDEDEEAKPRATAGLIDAVADAVDAPSDEGAKVVTNLDPETVEAALKELPQAQRGLFRGLVAAAKAEIKAVKDEVAKERNDLVKLEQRIQEAGRQLARNRADFAAMFGSDKFKEMLGHADKKDEELPSIMTPEGQAAHMQREIARRFKEFQAPIEKEAATAQKMHQLEQFRAANPEMRDPAVSKEVAQYLKAAKDRNEKVGLQTAFNAVMGLRAAREARARAEAERKAARETNRHVARATTPSSPDRSVIPAWVTTDGYKGVKGRAATTLYIHDNPHLRAKWRREVRAAK